MKDTIKYSQMVTACKTKPRERTGDCSELYRTMLKVVLFKDFGSFIFARLLILFVVASREA